tara:strand:- start:190707 stop:191894 length:1188 start_codon:yes stop_codon:yes gene_type:complete
MIPSVWQEKTISEILERVVNPVDVVSDQVYREIGIRSHGKGIFHKEPATGESLGNKRVFHVEPECFVVNIVFAWEQAVAKTTVEEATMIASHRFPMYRPKKGRCDVDFILYFFKTPKGKYLLELASPGGAGRNKTLGQTEFSKLKLTVPPTKEQKKISQILSIWDKSIETAEKLLIKSKAQKKSLLQKLLTGKKRLPGYKGKWEVQSLGSLFKERVETNRSDLPLLSITSDRGVIFQDESGRKNNSNDNKSKYRRICVDDIGYNTMRMWQGRSCISDKEGIVSPAYTILEATKEACPLYASYLFKLPELVYVFYRHSQGLVSDTWNLKYNHFKKITWTFPPLKEQQAIARVLKIADDEIELLVSKIEYLKQEKKALMQQLLTGKVRVNVDNPEVA